jgi:hypothetical protein
MTGTLSFVRLPIGVKLLEIIFLGAIGAAISWTCDCMAPRPACAYIGLSDAIFLGRVSFTNDDSSGTYTQATLVRFDIEEAFKGISPGTKQVWADPGSFTSCYEEYHFGERYLIFAQRSQSSGDSAAMTFVTAGQILNYFLLASTRRILRSFIGLRNVRGRGRRIIFRI